MYKCIKVGLPLHEKLQIEDIQESHVFTHGSALFSHNSPLSETTV